MTQMTIYSRETIEAVLNTDSAKVAEAILGLYARQTADEQQTQDTVHQNGRGFNFKDAPFLSSLAQALPRWRNRMTPKQLAAARKMLPKYWRQIGEILYGDAAVREDQVVPVEQMVQPTVTFDMSSVPNWGKF